MERANYIFKLASGEWAIVWSNGNVTVTSDDYALSDAVQSSVAGQCALRHKWAHRATQRLEPGRMINLKGDE